jgi:hypothetical protein
MISLWNYERPLSPQYCRCCRESLAEIGGYCSACYDIFIESKIDERREHEREAAR